MEMQFLEHRLDLKFQGLSRLSHFNKVYSFFEERFLKERAGSFDPALSILRQTQEDALLFLPLICSDIR